MRKITILSIALIAVSLASCVKERECDCTVTSDEPGVDPQSYKIVYKDVTKKRGKAACLSQKVTPDGQQYTETTTCTLK